MATPSSRVISGLLQYKVMAHTCKACIWTCQAALQRSPSLLTAFVESRHPPDTAWMHTLQRTSQSPCTPCAASFRACISSASLSAASASPHSAVASCPVNSTHASLTAASLCFRPSSPARCLMKRRSRMFAAGHSGSICMVSRSVWRQQQPHHPQAQPNVNVRADRLRLLGATQLSCKHSGLFWCCLQEQSAVLTQLSCKHPTVLQAQRCAASGSCDVQSHCLLSLSAAAAAHPPPAPAWSA